MDYRLANASDIPALTAFAGNYYAGTPDTTPEAREKLYWTRLGDERRIVIFEDDDILVAALVYKPSPPGFDLEEFIVDGGGLIAAEAFHLLLGELLAPTAKVCVTQPVDSAEAMQFWRTQGFEPIEFPWPSTTLRAVPPRTTASPAPPPCYDGRSIPLNQGGRILA